MRRERGGEEDTILCKIDAQYVNPECDTLWPESSLCFCDCDCEHHYSTIILDI